MRIQAMWSPFQGSLVLPWRWTMVLKPQRDLEHVGTTMVPFYQKIMDPRLCELIP